MKHCEHKHTEKKIVKEKILGKDFAFRGEVCSECNSVLWTDATQRAFNHWLLKLHERKPNLFVLQPRLSDAAKKYLDKIHDLFKDHSRATIIRAIVYVFIDDLAQDPRFAERAQKVKETDVYDYFMKGEKKPVRVRVKPSQLLDLVSWSKITGYAPAKVMEVAVIGFLSLFRQNEKNKVNQELEQLTELIRDVLRAA